MQAHVLKWQHRQSSVHSEDHKSKQRVSVCCGASQSPQLHCDHCQLQKLLRRLVREPNDCTLNALACSLDHQLR